MLFTRRNTCAFMLVLFFGSLTSIGLADRTHKIEAEDYFSLGVMTGCQLSPNGKYLVYSETRWEPPAEKRNMDLWQVEVATKKVKRLTFDRAADSSPKWSADGKFIYFTSSRKRGDETDPPYNGKKQVWRIAVDGGELFPVTRVDDGIVQFVLSDDGQSLYYTTSVEVVEDEWNDLRTKFKSLKYAHGVDDFSQLWKLDLVQWRSEKLVDEHRYITSFDVTTDERRIAMLTTPDNTLLTNEGWSQIDVYDMATKKVTNVTPDGWRDDHPVPHGWLDAVTFSADGDALAFTVSYDGYSPQIYLLEWRDDRPNIQKLDHPADVTVIGGTTHFRGETRELCFLGDIKATKRLYCMLTMQGGVQVAAVPRTPVDAVVGAYSYAKTGNQLAVVLSTTTHPPDAFIVNSPGSVDRLTNINPQVDTWIIPQIKRYHWKGAGGDEVEGILELPADYQPGKPLPTVVEIHGGPTSATHHELRFWIYGRTLLASKGYAVLSPNYRGSTGYGDKFLTDLIGRENDIEVKDILAGVDQLVADGIADPDRLGVMGWSNGGYLTNCLITTTDRFKAASSGAGVLDQIIQWGTEDTPGHVINFMQGQPWTKPGAYHKGSPIYNLGQVKTPTLIHVGENDPRVPPAHSRTLYRALKHYLNVPTELVVYPDEGHGLTTYTHRKAKMKWYLGWFDKYLLGKTDDSADATKKEHEGA